MRAPIEKRLLQIIVAIACLVPIVAGAAGVARGALPLLHGGATSTDLESHFRYLSGILFCIGIGFATCVPQIEIKGERFDILSLIVIVGGMARLVALLAVGTPSRGHLIGLGIELLLVPVLVYWRGRVERRMAVTGLPRTQAPHPLFSRRKG